MCTVSMNAKLNQYCKLNGKYNKCHEARLVHDKTYILNLKWIYKVL